MISKDTAFMQLAIKEAIKGYLNDEVPVGAVLVSQAGDILSLRHNKTISYIDPTAHAEILVLREAAQKIKNYRLINTTLYVTIEPCLMCMGAIIHSRVSKVVYGAGDSKWGAAGSLYNFGNDTRLNHQVEIIEGVEKKLCSSLIKNYFRTKRKFYKNNIK